ncbi:Hypothetical protein, predicted transmembrane protein [Metamycoplasma auris 15026]|uniref:Uncharacterized protein n=1 Tax=Metamycoplasma auris 15026 TaxID=1188233 RepID=N9TRL8_9BACT|nr:hypothetical protein [Metamycoplasma auris]ENY68700.1 Hypothetical protein, predicted transmembrane protein [Metamycoplasma auris 15026]
MKFQKSKLRKFFEVATWITIPTVTAASIGGAIYYVVKNSRSIQKEFFSVSQFKEEAKKIRLNPEVFGSLEASDLYEDFKNRQAKAKQIVDDYIKKYPQIDWNKIIKQNIPKHARVLNFGNKKESHKKIINNLPKSFDTHEYLKSKIQVELDFQKTKYLDFRFTNIEKIENDKTKLRIEYKVFLNYEYASGDFEPKSKRYTKASKYYYTNSEVVTFYSNDLKIYNGSKFATQWQENKTEVETIIRKLNENNKSIDKQIQQLEEKIKEENTNQEQLRKKIEQLKENKKKVFISSDFYNQIFEWFKKTIDKTDAYSDNYKKEDGFVIEPYTTTYSNNNLPYILWNPTKGLNELTIKFIFVKKDAPKKDEIKSYPKAIIFTLDNV